MNIITNDLKNLYRSLIDELLKSGSLSLPCKLFYDQSLFNECINCKIDPISHKSANIYKSNGPIPFTDGQICPYCRGLGGSYQESYDITDLLVVFDYKHWINFNSRLHDPDGLVQTINSKNDYQKIKNCNKIIIDTNLQNYTENYFQRNSEPQPAGFGDNQYFFTFWKKI